MDNLEYYIFVYFITSFLLTDWSSFNEMCERVTERELNWRADETEVEKEKVALFRYCFCCWLVIKND